MDGPATFRIRAAQPRDKRAVRALCARIWSDDYIPDLFDAWVRDRRGRFWVAVDGGHLIGIAKLTLTGEQEAWLHALRVDPRHRRKGVGTALLEHRLERARRLGARVARLDTQEDNIPVQRMMRRFGLRLREVDGYFERGARSVVPPRRASRADVPAVTRLAAGALIQDQHLARALARPDIARAVREGRCVVAGEPSRPTAFAIVVTQRRSFSGSRLSVGALGGSSRGVRELMAALPAGPTERGLSQPLGPEIHLRAPPLSARRRARVPTAQPGVSTADSS